MRRTFLIAGAFGLTAVVLTGCGGGGGPSPAPTPKPPAPPAGPTPPPTPPPPPPMKEHTPFRAVSYNLFWWCMSGGPNHGGKTCPQYAGGKGFNQIWAKMKEFGPYDLVGMQECDDASKMFNGIGYGATHEWKQGPADIGMGFDKTKFDKLGDWGSAQYSGDQWGPRYIAWIRLKQKDGGANIFFGNLHGPLPGPAGSMDGKHGHEVAASLTKIVAANIQPGDAMVITGDFNALPFNTEIWDLNKTWDLAANDKTTHFDHIYMNANTTKRKDWNSHNGAPSDHSILWADLQALTPLKDGSEITV